ncbi:hypothetical protein BSKO_05381 [Bryopsis sp. KO-2023]|nr:hypothetical protein BSKO_05381 [Bryopsis sp. KO-2023]
MFSFSTLGNSAQLRGIPPSERPTLTRQVSKDLLPGTSAFRRPVNRPVQKRGSGSEKSVARGEQLRAIASSSLSADCGDGESIRYLSSFGFSDDDICKIVTTAPEILALSRSRVQGVLEFLLGLVASTDKIRSIVLRHPDALLSPLDTKAKPAVEFLYDLGLDRESVSSILVRYPHVLGHGVKSDLTPQVHYLVSLGVSREAIPALVKERPQVLGECIEPVIRYLKMLGLKRRDIGKMLASFPIDYSIPVQCPKKTESHQE